VRLDPAEQLASGRLIVAEVLPESPAAVAGIPIGSELLAIDGQALGMGGISLDRGLQRSAGRRVRLRIGLPESQGEQELALRPIGSAAYDLLVYRSWVAQNERIVHTLSNDQLGYIHIPEMSPAAYDQFLVDLDTEIYGKRGLVIDVRFNHGGFTAPFVIDVLMRPSLIFMSQRDGALGDAGTLAGNRVLNRPSILLVNQQSASNAEMLAEFYRGAGLGQIVGQPTAGAVIGIQRARLLDGATYNLPRMRVVDRHGQELEGTGRPVDHAVLMPLGDPARGRDPQLETAVQTLMAQIGITRE
jgi:C-terminal processing protease CtpA/Prc